MRFFFDLSLDPEDLASDQHRDRLAFPRCPLGDCFGGVMVSAVTASTAGTASNLLYSALWAVVGASHSDAGVQRPVSKNESMLV